eukprot:8677283-Alexandrium_andersonii.AAC.1
MVVRGLPTAPSLGCSAGKERTIVPSQWTIARAWWVNCACPVAPVLSVWWSCAACCPEPAGLGSSELRRVESCSRRRVG